MKSCCHHSGAIRSGPSARTTRRDPFHVLRHRRHEVASPESGLVVDELRERLEGDAHLMLMDEAVEVAKRGRLAAQVEVVEEAGCDGVATRHTP